MALLDTTVLIDLSRRGASPAHQRAIALLERLAAAEDPLFTTRLNEAEFRVGQFRVRDRALEASKVERVLAAVSILDFDAAAAIRFARVQAALLDRGRPAGEIDALVAAIALEVGQPLATRNPAHFSEIDGLTLIRY